jgi:hypothetical protein
MYYVKVDRGEETGRKFASNINDLLYYVFSAITFEMALRFELENRIESEDFRRIMFRKQEELLGVLDKMERKRRNKT